MHRSPDPSNSPAGRNALYLFCLTRADALPWIDGVGVDGSGRLQLVPLGDVAAVVCTVNAEDFCGPGADTRLKDLAWVGPRVCRHEEVVEAVMRASAVVPARFATLFSSTERLAAWLRAHHAAISGALDRFACHEEWAMKGALDRRRAEAPLLAAALARGARAVSPGARYLEERRIRVGIGRELSLWLDAVRDALQADLRPLAAEFRERQLGSHVSEDDGTPVLNWAFLLSRRSVDGFRARLAEVAAPYAERGLTLDLSGPWPPYSFCPALEPGRAE